MDSVTTRRLFARTALLALALASSGAAPIVARADHGGCFVYGEVQGLDTIRNCEYTALTGTQNVYVGAPYAWRIWVLRHTPTGQPVDLTLASGIGPVPGPPPQVHPVAGETVHVSMEFGCTGPYCGTLGFLGAGLEEGHP